MFDSITRKFGLSILVSQDIKARRNVRDLSFLYLSILASVAVVLVVFAILWSRLMVVNIGYEISKANTQRSELIEQNKRLRVEYMRLKSPERVEKIASGELGLVHPSGEQIVNIK